MKRGFVNVIRNGFYGKKLFVTPQYTTAEEMKCVRAKLGLTQKEFATPIRLWYMHNENVCTIIDVNEIKREVHIKNYTDNIMFRAFGTDEEI